MGEFSFKVVKLVTTWTWNHVYPWTAPISLRGRLSSAFYTHKTRTATMFFKKTVKMHSVAFQLSVQVVFVASFWDFFCISVIHPKENLIKMWKKNWETEYYLWFKYIEWSWMFSVSTNNKKKMWILIKTKLHSIKGCEESTLAHRIWQFSKFCYLNISNDYILRSSLRKLITTKFSYIIMYVNLSIMMFLPR